MFKFFKKKENSKKGQSLPEMMMTIALVAIILIVVFRNMGGSFKEAINVTVQRLQQSSAFSQSQADQS